MIIPIFSPIGLYFGPVKLHCILLEKSLLSGSGWVGFFPASLPSSYDPFSFLVFSTK